MGYKREDFKHYKVTWPDGYVSTFAHLKRYDATEEEIKGSLIMRDTRNPTDFMSPVKVKRVK
jgi:hypothetical protein